MFNSTFKLQKNNTCIVALVTLSKAKYLSDPLSELNRCRVSFTVSILFESKSISVGQSGHLPRMADGFTAIHNLNKTKGLLLTCCKCWHLFVFEYVLITSTHTF